MKIDEKEKKVEETEEKKEAIFEDLSDDDVDELSGGFGAFSNVPRVPTNKIDETLKNKI